MPTLIITNGDSAVDLLHAAGKRDTIIPWRDVLHEGPIVGDGLEASSAVRAAWLAERLRLDAEDVALTLAERDELMRRHGEFDRIELWFEHDLYDQLQLVQILSFFADEGRRDGLILVQADDFLGHQRPDTILRFSREQRAIDEDTLDLGDRAWADLSMPTPEPIARHLAEPEPALPFLAPALHRFLEELPAPETGLTRTEATALAILAAGAMSPVKLFHETIAQEEAAFMGDASFYGLLDDLAFAETPLIAGLPRPQAPDFSRFRSASIALTEAGKSALAGSADRIALTGIDRWWAGTRLHGKDTWRFDRDAMELVPPTFPA